LDTLQILLQVFPAPEGRGQYRDEGSLGHKNNMTPFWGYGSLEISKWAPCI
jgi:hypothetical protein